MNTVRREELKSRWRGCQDLPSDAQHAYLSELSAHDPEMAGELTSLLRASEASGDFLERGFAPTLPKRLGVWQPIRELGRGGMGQVFHAVRAIDGFEQQAAVKTLRSDLASPGQARRFERERQILARLNHPNIARLLDGGADSEGLPFLAMEFVDGVAIDVWAEGKTLDAKLALFAEACRALDYAHRHLIVHCDLKPSNILVNRDGQVKVLDFGIARLLTPEGDLATAQHLTPQYASPEQLRNHPLSTGSDIYSLGVLLYKLLTGRLPYSATQTRTTDPVELARQICEARALSLGPGFPADLEAIVAKALAKEPADRYASAAAFAQDLERFRLGRSVEARPLPRTLEYWRWLKRHRWGSLAAAAALLALLATMGWALRERERAQRMLVQSREMSGSLIWEVEKALRHESPTEARRILLARTASYLNDLAGGESLDRELAIEVAESYRLLGNAMGEQKDDKSTAVYERGLALLEPWRDDPRARFTQARLLIDAGPKKNIDRALLLLDELARHPESLPRWRWAHASATAQERLGVFVVRSGDYQATAQLWTKGLLLARQSQSQHPGPEADSLVARLERRMGAISTQLSRLDEAVRHYAASSTLEENGYRQNPGSANATNLATSLSETAFALRALSRYSEAASPIDRSLQLRRKLYESDPSSEYYRFALSNILTMKGANLVALGHLAEAGPLLREAEAIASPMKDGGIQKAQVQLALATWLSKQPAGAAAGRAKAAEALRTVEALHGAGMLPAYKSSLLDNLRALAR